MKSFAVYQLNLRNFTVEGTLKAAEKLVGHIADIGFDTIYLMALNSADDSIEGQSKRQLASGYDNPKNPYRIVDYYDVDEEYGTLDDLKSFINEAHKFNLKVLIDIVYFHCGPKAVFLKEHPEFVLRNEDGSIDFGKEWPFARFDFENKDVWEFFYKNLEFYVKEVGVDGFRFDCGDLMPLEFWKDVLGRVMKLDPNLIMLNEGDRPEDLCCFDTVYRFDKMYVVNRTFAHEVNSGKKHKYVIPEDDTTVYTAKVFRQKIEEIYKIMPLGSTLNTSENHDTASDMYEQRFEAFLGEDGAAAVLALQLTFDGVPMIYNGQELADTVRKSMFWNRFCKDNQSLQWENLLTEKGQRRMALIKALTHIRKNRPSILNGDLKWIDHSGDENVIGFSRNLNGETTNVFINVTARAQETEFKVNNVLLSNKASIGNGKISFEPYGFVIAE
ncbi:MAG: hypothetical protein IKM42_05100 [Clostridia bacterium]|nr:hypothetical protein [Clostridia bacterium]